MAQKYADCTKWGNVQNQNPINLEKFKPGGNMEDVEFYVNLIKCQEGQTYEAKQSIKDNCTHIDGEYYIFEGELWVLDTNNVVYDVVGQGDVHFLGGLSTEELKQICLDIFDVKI